MGTMTWGRGTDEYEARDQLAAFLSAGGSAPPEDVIEGLKLASFFLERHVYEPRGMRFPEQQDWIIRALAERPH